MVPAPMHRVEDVPSVNTGVPTVAVMFTTRDTTADGPLHPNAVVLIVTVPAKPVDQVITPEEFIDPAEGLLTVHVNPVLSIALVE